MNLVFDIGNTKTAIGCWDAGELRGHWRVTGELRHSVADFGRLMCALLEQAGIRSGQVQEVTFVSVVPSLSPVLLQVAEQHFGLRALAVDARSALPIRLDIDEPARVGADRIVNVLAAHDLCRTDVIVVDLGTATTFNCVSAQGIFIGGAIAPGIGTSAQALSERTAQLPAVEINRPSTAIGRATVASLQSGIFWGAVDGVDGMVARMRAEWRRPDALVVATGGLSPLVGPHCSTVDQIDPLLALRGLRIAREHHNQQVR